MHSQAENPKLDPLSAEIKSDIGEIMQNLFNEVPLLSASISVGKAEDQVVRLVQRIIHDAKRGNV